MGRWIQIFSVLIVLIGAVGAAKTTPPHHEPSRVRADIVQDDLPITPRDQGVELFDALLADDSTPILHADRRYTFPSHHVYPEVIPHPDGRHVVTLTQFTAIEIWSLLAMAWPEYLLLLTILVLLWRAVGRWKRPQKKGHEYCRKCNYLLANLPGEVCPECGTRLTPRMRRQGSRRLPRVAVHMVILISLLIGYGFTIHKWPRDIWPASFPRWWSTWLDRVAAANLQYPWLEDRSSVVSRVMKIDMEDASVERVVHTFPGMLFNSLQTQVRPTVITSDGTFLSTITNDGVFYVIDLRDGRVQTQTDLWAIRHPAHPDTSVRAGLSALSGVFDVQRVGADVVATILKGPHEENVRAGEIALAAVDLKSGEIRWYLEAAEDGSRPNQFYYDVHTGSLLTVGNYPRADSMMAVRWSIDSLGMNPMPVDRIVPADGDEIPHDIAFDGRKQLRPMSRFTHDGSLLLFETEAGAWTMSTATGELWRATRLHPLHRNGRAMAWSPKGAMLAVQVRDGYSKSLDDDDRYVGGAVVDVESRRIAARLALGFDDLRLYGAWFSPDDRFLYGLTHSDATISLVRYDLSSLNP